MFDFLPVQPEPKDMHKAHDGLLCLASLVIMLLVLFLAGYR